MKISELKKLIKSLISEQFATSQEIQKFKYLDSKDKSIKK